MSYTINTLSPVADPKMPYDVANKKYVDRIAGDGVTFAASDNVNSSGTRSIQWWFSSLPREGTSGVPSNNDFIAVRDMVVLSLLWTWRGEILSNRPQPYFTIYDTDGSAELFATPVSVRDEVHSFEPPNPVALEAGKPYAMELNSANGFVQNNTYRMTGELILGDISTFDAVLAAQKERMPELQEQTRKKYAALFGEDAAQSANLGKRLKEKIDSLPGKKKKPNLD